MLRQALVGGAYLGALYLFRAVSVQHWFILTGLHLAVLMLVPYRYWPALFIADTGRLAFISYTCFDRYGACWALLNTIPSLAYEAPVVWWFREHRQLFPSKGTVNMPAFVLCALIIAIISTVETIVELQFASLPPGYVIHYGEVTARMVLGNFMGVLTVAPIALVIYQSFAAANFRWRHWLHGLLGSRFLLESMLGVLPLVAFLVWLGLRDPQIRAMAQMAMFVPVIFMAFRYGWQGAAVAGTLASLGIVTLMPATNDRITMQAETLVAMAVSTMLLVGARMAALNRWVEQERFDSRMAMALAQRNAALGEAQLQITAQALNQFRSLSHGIFNKMPKKERQTLHVVDGSGYRRDVEQAQEQLFLLTDSLDPSMLHERGLAGALSQGALARTLHEGGIKYWCDLRGPASVLSQTMNLAVYRVVCEAVAEACIKHEPSDVLVKVRCGARGRPWVVVMIDARRNLERTMHVDWLALRQRLRISTTGLGRKAIEDRAATFDGQVRERVIHDGWRMLVSFLEPNHPRD
ncbi:MASE1 domain-containing protein [Rhodanobacter sp. DHG33]|uniref:MASE1 domain-containing protein n=1 Tax=Rhodanobacter sp. DHG33 TaxID=2775921 RepID=UPI001780C09C|nr:MASE1 domain-containing protein [Rhodanobacter sp. DHG33]MBD8897713.1 MASE1 domain-containing protein [Rhodanobacter sp. DHG33]